jgi:hypothetical protein
MSRVRNFHLAVSIDEVADLGEKLGVWQASTWNLLRSSNVERPEVTLRTHRTMTRRSSPNSSVSADASADQARLPVSGWRRTCGEVAPITSWYAPN